MFTDTTVTPIGYAQQPAPDDTDPDAYLQRLSDPSRPNLPIQPRRRPAPAEEIEALQRWPMDYQPEPATGDELPQDRTAEQALIASALKNPAVVRESEAEPEWFTHATLRRIWRAVQATDPDAESYYGELAGTMTDQAELESQAERDRFMGRAIVTLASVDLGQGPAYRWPEYQQRIQEAALRRQLISAAQALAEAAWTGTGTVEQIKHQHEERLRRITPHRAGGVSVDDLLAEWQA